ncbi:hypothetical protein K438DRAFT_1976037 [Mycena galopus ATCC 62051]|nr:hypothetical protein K438DRAFT_1976037 [Mycena galopus ATCC 62051]
MYYDWTQVFDYMEDNKADSQKQVVAYFATLPDAEGGKLSFTQSALEPEFQFSLQAGPLSLAGFRAFKMTSVDPGTKESYLGAFLEDIIYGIYLSAFIECCLLFKRKETKRNAKQIYVIFTALLMFILITMRCIIDTYRCVTAFDAVGAQIGFGTFDSTISLVTNACWFFLTPVADALIIFRTFHVYNRNWWIIIIPTALCIANLGSSIWVTLSLSKFDTEGLSNVVFKSLNLFLALSICTNVICTGLISFRILNIHRQISELADSRPTYTMRVVSVIVESGRLQIPPTIGLVFAYIIIRVSRGTSYESTVMTQSMHFRRGNMATAPSYELDAAAREAVQVHLQRETESETRVTGRDERHNAKDADKTMPVQSSATTALLHDPKADPDACIMLVRTNGAAFSASLCDQDDTSTPHRFICSPSSSHPSYNAVDYLSLVTPSHPRTRLLAHSIPPPPPPTSLHSLRHHLASDPFPSSCYLISPPFPSTSYTLSEYSVAAGAARYNGETSPQSIANEDSAGYPRRDDRGYLSQESMQRKQKWNT